MVTFKDEKGVKKRVRALLNEHGWFWWMPPMTGYGAIGVSDFNALRGGVFLAVETKFGKNTATVHQKAYLNSICAEGGFGFIVSDKTLHEFEQWLKAFDRSVERVANQEPRSDEDSIIMLNCVAKLTEPLVQSES